MSNVSHDCGENDCHCYQRGWVEGNESGFEHGYDDLMYENASVGPAISTLPDIALAHRYRTGLVRVREYADEMAERVLQRDLDGL